MSEHQAPNTRTKSGGSWKYILIAFLIVVIFLAVLHKLRRDPSLQPVMNLQPWALQTGVVKTGTVNDVFPALGRVQSASEINLAPQIGGRVLQLGPREGAKVDKGQLLVRIDTSELVANRNALKAQLLGARNAAETALRDYERAVKLRANDFVAESVLDAKRAKKLSTLANVRALESQIKSLNIKISYGEIRAPLAARVTARTVEIGDRVFPGRPVYKLSAQNGGRVIIAVPLSILAKVKPGGRVALLSDGEQQMAAITRINPALDRFSMGSLEVDLPQRPFNLPDGSPISVNVLTRTLAHSLIVPPDSLMPSDDEVNKAVFVVQDTAPQKLLKVPVDVKLCGVEGCAISGALSAGDVVVRAHGSVLLKLHDGDPVTTDWHSEGGK